MLWKLKLKSLIAYLIYNSILLTISYFLNRFFQILIFILFFSFIQNCFKYRFHADTIIKEPVKAVFVCKIITISVEIIYLLFCENLNISIYSNLFIIFLIAFINCLLEFGIENTIIKNDVLKDKNKLLELCQKANLTDNATNRMVLKYIENKSYQEIADLECVDIESIKKSINRSKKRILKG